MRSICLNFEINHIQCNNSELSDNEKRLFNEDINRELIKKYYSKINDILIKISSEFGSLFKYSISISKDSLGFYNTYNPSFIDSLKQLNKLSVSYLHTLSSLSAITNSNKLTNEITDYQIYIRSLLNKECTNILYDSGLLNKELLNSINKSDISAILVNKSFDNNNNKVLLSDEIHNIKLLQNDSGFLTSFIDSNNDLDSIINILNNKPDDTEIVNININYSDFIDNEVLLSKLKEFPEKLMSESNYAFISLEDAFNYSEAKYIAASIDSIADNILSINYENEYSKQLIIECENVANEVYRCRTIEKSDLWRQISSINLYRNFETDIYANQEIKELESPAIIIDYVLSDYNRLVSSLDICNEGNDSYKTRFADIENMPKLKVKKLFSGFDAQTILYSIENQSAELKDRVLSNIPYKILDEVESIMSDSKISKIEIRNARRRILTKLKKIN